MTPQQIETMIVDALAALGVTKFIPAIVLQDLVQAVFDFIQSHLEPVASMSTSELAAAVPKAVPMWLVPLIIQTAQAILAWIQAHNNPPVTP